MFSRASLGLQDLGIVLSKVDKINRIGFNLCGFLFSLIFSRLMKTNPYF